MCNRESSYGQDNHVKDAKKYAADRFSGVLFETLEAVIYALIVAVAFMTFFFRVISISGNSMENTLHNFDKVLINRFNYVPKCGDIVVIKRGQYLDQPLVKRVIATEGQTIKIDYNNQAVLVDGVKTKEDYVTEPMIFQNDDYIPEKIPKGYCFVMGDNRNKSLDSRSGAVGLIKNKNVIGRAIFVIFSFYKIGPVR